MAHIRLATAEDFEPWLGRKVQVNAEPNPIELTLDRIERTPPLPGLSQREPFSLFFTAPLNVFLLDTAYEFDCGTGGPHMITISQMPPMNGLRHYQAVFG